MSFFYCFIAVLCPQFIGQHEQEEQDEQADIPFILFRIRLLIHRNSHPVIRTTIM